MLLDEHGHAHLTDFNIAVYFNPSKPLMSIAGSMAYMAPEVLLRKGYFESVDWWSLGVVMFELLFGKVRDDWSHCQLQRNKCQTYFFWQDSDRYPPFFLSWK